MTIRAQSIFTGCVYAIVALSVVLADAGAIAGTDASRGERVASLLERLAEADALRDAEKIEDAGPIYREALVEANALGFESLPLVRAVDGLADFERAQGRAPEAERLYVESIKLWEKLLGPNQPRLAVSLHNLGVLYLDRGDCDKATPYLNRANAIWVSNFGADSEQSQNTSRALNSCLDSPTRATDGADEIRVPREPPKADSFRPRP